MMFLPIFCLVASSCSPEGAERNPTTQNSLRLTAAGARSQNPLDRPVPNLADVAALANVLNSLSPEGGNQSDRAVFDRWAKGKVLIIQVIRQQSNGKTDVSKLGSSFTADHVTVGDVIRMQRASEGEETKRVEASRVRHAQGICEEMRSSPEHSSYWIGFGGGYTIGGKHYDDPCHALRDNGYPELDDSEDAVRSRANEAKIKNEARNEDEDLERRWREEFGNK